MPVVNPEKLVGLQQNADGIRNVSCTGVKYLPYYELTAKDLHIGTCREYHLLPAVITNDLTLAEGSRQDISYRRTHRHKWHHFPEACWKDPIP